MNIFRQILSLCIVLLFSVLSGTAFAKPMPAASSATAVQQLAVLTGESPRVMMQSYTAKALQLQVFGMQMMGDILEKQEAGIPLTEDEKLVRDTVIAMAIRKLLRLPDQVVTLSILSS